MGSNGRGEAAAPAKDLFDRPSKADTGARNAFDFYETPAWMTLSLLNFQPFIKGSAVIEPCSGLDAISSILRAAGCVVSTNDIDARHPSQTHLDATDAAYWSGAAPPFCDWVITNPPFGMAFPILQRAFEHAQRGVALLLRKSFTEPTEERGPWLSVHPPTREIGLPRHSFRGTGSDSVATDWFIWERQPDRSLPPFIIDHIAKSRRTA